MSQCAICDRKFSTPKPGTGRSKNLCRECEAKRSGVPQGCLPSANCSAEAGAEALSDSLISSVVPPKEAIRALVQHFVVITNMNGLEETECEDLQQAFGIIQFAIFKGATKFGLFVRAGESPALAVQRQRAIRRNDQAERPAGDQKGTE